uniref:Uncharacterized protein n=1 Tax=Podoviridae sp. ctdDI2 TaxID=2826567 RepID=A0A8S5NQ12_9CAUD|nr:MAG TPA: hypothetical protein [Podoviridae sp. ctdDI2]
MSKIATIILSIALALILPAISWFLIMFIYNFNKWVTSLMGGNEMVTATMTVVSCLLIIICATRLIENGEN